MLVALVSGCDLVDSPEQAERILTPARRAIDRAQQRAPAKPLAIEPDVVDAKPPVTEDASAAAPTNYVVMTPVARSGEFGHAVLLVHPSEDVVVPIYIGGTEALSIQLRLEHQKFTRPLTHDLLDTLVTQLGGKMLRAQVNALKSGVFVGSVIFDEGGRILELDARPSDAIALAIGNRVPIYVAKDVVAEAGIRPGEISDAPPDSKTPPVAL